MLNSGVVQVPQFILEEALANGTGASTNVICTQPRRLPAVALANRVADEMCQACGSLVGYSIRLEKKSSKDTRLLFCTTGINLCWLSASGYWTVVLHHWKHCTHAVVLVPINQTTHEACPTCLVLQYY